MNLLHDIRLAVRVLGRSPAFALTALAVLTLGIGANTAIFSVVNSVLLRPLSYPDPQRLVSVYESEPDHPVMNVSGPNFHDWHDQSSAFSGMAAWSSSPVDMIGGMEPDRVMVGVVSKNFFSMMGARPILGRVFRDDEQRRGGAPVTVIGEGLWRRSFNSDRNVLGRVLRMDGTNFTVVGVLPASFDFPRLTDAWVSAEPWWNNDEGRDAHNFHVIARLRGDATLQQAQSQMAAIAARIAHSYPAANRGVTAKVMPLQAAAAAKIAPTLQLLLGASAFVLLIACANVANLLLCRVAARQREISVRIALGAGRWRLLRQLLAESILLSLTAGTISVVLAEWITGALKALLPEGTLPVESIAIDWRVLAFAIAVSVGAGVLFSLLPGANALRVDVNEALKAASSRTVVSASGRRFRSALIAVEVAVSFVLLAGAGLTLKSLMRMHEVDPGFDSHNLTIVEMALAKGDHLQQPVPEYRRILDRVAASRDVTAAALSSSPPLGDGSPNGAFEIAGRPVADPRKAPWATYALVSAYYFRAMGIPVLQGRTFTASDLSNPNVAVISRAMAKRLWPSGNAIGERIRFFGFELQPQWLTIVGICGDVRQYGIADQPDDQVYVPYFQNLRYGAGYLNLIVHTRGPAPGLDAAIRGEVRAVDANSVLRFTSMDAYIAKNVATPRLRAILLGSFAGFSLLLAAIGLYGVVSYSAATRHREAGVRAALGAERRDIVALFVGDAAPTIAIGLAVGVAAAIALSRAIRGFLFGVSPLDPSTFISLALILAGVAFLLC